MQPRRPKVQSRWATRGDKTTDSSLKASPLGAPDRLAEPEPTPRRACAGTTDLRARLFSTADEASGEGSA
eukprot:2385718-Heterocapsa_arctica.AAC.1